MKCLLFTLDYELFGNGSGDVFKHIIEPTNRILATANKHHAKFTIFFEVVEYWKIKEEWEKGNKMGYTQNPIKAIENQIIQAYKDGHDIQLHLHPQWVDAVYKDGKWVVNLSNWRLGDYHEVNNYNLINLLKKGKETLENLLKPIDSNYSCFALRAGGYNIQPSEDLVKAMQATGFKVDSSIYPGGFEKGPLSKYDYRNIPFDCGMWETGNRLEDKGNSGIYEIPIVAFPVTRFIKYLNWNRISSFFKHRTEEKEALQAKIQSNRNTFFQKIRFFFEKEQQTWDFCILSNLVHRQYIHRLEKQNRDVFVIIGHPKGLIETNDLEYVLQKTQKDFKYPTITELYNQFIS